MNKPHSDTEASSNPVEEEGRLSPMLLTNRTSSPRQTFHEPVERRSLSTQGTKLERPMSSQSRANGKSAQCNTQGSALLRSGPGRMVYLWERNSPSSLGRGMLQ